MFRAFLAHHQEFLHCLVSRSLWQTCGCAVLNTDRAVLNTDRAVLNTNLAILNTDRAILNTVFQNSSACQ
jgi:hypothetical protein